MKLPWVGALGKLGKLNIKYYMCKTFLKYAIIYNYTVWKFQYKQTI